MPLLSPALLVVALEAAATITPRDEARDFGPEVKRLFAVVACGTTEIALAPEDEALRREHCAALEPVYARYQRFWTNRVEPTLGPITPKDAGRPVVYPFGGGDLVTALGTFTEAPSVTSLSLEPTGDVRVFFQLPVEARRERLAQARRNLTLLLVVEHSKTSNMRDMTATGLTAELVFTLAALRVRGFEPVALRYFDLAPDGSIDYLSSAEVDARDRELEDRRASPRARALRFGNAELVFRRAGERERVFRHIAGNLVDEELAKDDRAVKHLEVQGRVFAMTKAASYLLWSPRFSRVRDFLLAQADFMISDSTGLPPEHARAHGFRQLTWGSFAGPYLPARRRIADDFVALWNEQPKRRLPFRYGYPDSAGNNHMLVTTRLPEPPDAPATAGP